MDEVKEFLIYSAIGLPLGIIGLNLFAYYMASSHHMTRLYEEQSGRRNSSEGNLTSREIAKRDLEYLESQNWLTRNVLRVGERIAYKGFLKEHI